ncbi:MAG: hypothetical protein COA42_21810 [Alteromonadaceae bacterium]|nr:MAG: hypothetical protein COA42_21810 [Alteromonadaceae bacterium]
MMDIKPGIGLGDIKYGITIEELIQLLGKPDQIDEEECFEGSGEWTRDLLYFSRGLNFTFDKADDYRLGVITVLGSGYRLLGKELFGLPKDAVKRLLAKATSEISKIEDWTWTEEDSLECLDHDGLGMLFWFHSGYLSEIQCGCLFEADNETVIWPA